MIEEFKGFCKREFELPVQVGNTIQGSFAIGCLPFSCGSTAIDFKIEVRNLLKELYDVHKFTFHEIAWRPLM